MDTVKGELKQAEFYLKIAHVFLNTASEIQARRLNIVQFNGPRGEKERDKYNSIISVKSQIFGALDSIKQTREEFKQ